MDIDWYLLETKSEAQAALAQATNDCILRMIPRIAVKRKWRIPVYSMYKDMCYMNFAGDQQLYIGFVNGDLMTQHPKLIRKNIKYTGKYFITEMSDI